MLRAHPEVFSTPVKETRYFCTRWQFHDINWYLAQFEGADRRLKVDVSPTYAALPERAIRMVRRLKPDIKLVLMLRDPAARGWSHVKHMWRNREGSFRFSEARAWPPPLEMLRLGVVDDWCVVNGSYADIIRRWTTVFPREQFFVGVTEQIERDPLPWLRQLSDFLGIDRRHAWPSELLFGRINAGIPGVPPDEIRDQLRLVYQQRARDAVSLLEEMFGISPASEWTDSLGILRCNRVEIGEYRGYRMWVSRE